MGAELQCIEYKQKWIYDGSISKSFPGLNLYGHEGHKGLTISNLKAFEYIEQYIPDYEWYCILEDDAIFNLNICEIILRIIQYKQPYHVIGLDKRFRGGCVGMLYNNHVINRLKKEMHPLSQFSIENETRNKHANLWDWKLYTYLETTNIPFGYVNLIDSGKAPS